MATKTSNRKGRELWFLKSTRPVFLPESAALTLQEDDFQAYLTQSLHNDAGDEDITVASTETAGTETVIGDEFRELDLYSATLDATPTTATSSTIKEEGEVEEDEFASSRGPFMDGLLGYRPAPIMTSVENKMFTENSDIAFQSTQSSLLDLFTELEEVVSGPRLHDLLTSAWQEDPLATLKIIFNSRSIHLGKASRNTFYRCAGWLAAYHPHTLLANIQWLSRPVIEKRAEKKDPDLDDMVVVQVEKDATDPTRFDVQNGLAHGYWKDLLNLVALSITGHLNVLANPRDILNVEKERSSGPGNRVHRSAEAAKVVRSETRDLRHETAINTFRSDVLHRTLHLTVARLFSAQLQSDMSVLRGGDPAAKRAISPCAKWAPSSDKFHDKHTFIVSSIAEILYPQHTIPEAKDGDRGTYLRYAREAYRKDMSALRKHLQIVERNLTDKTYDGIQYERLPSVAMNTYSPIFAANDTDRFSQYLDKVASGKARISGATLLPSTLIYQARQSLSPRRDQKAEKKLNALVNDRIGDLNKKVVDGQWNTLVQRIKESGTLESSIAVCDVSGSMTGPNFPDQTVPLDSSIGLSLLLAEVAKPPFNGAFITFSDTPQLQIVDLTKTLAEKYQALARSHWAMNTNFVAVFEDLILPMAINNNLKQEDMVKRVFVFSDMQFDSAMSGGERAWMTSYERIQKAFKDNGYEMPELVFWNLAGGRAGYIGNGWNQGGNPIAPKPVTADMEGVALVGGYSQAMLKVFLDEGVFEDKEAEESKTSVKHKLSEEDDDMVEVEKVKRQRIDPLSTMRKAISHKAYDMLKIVD